MSEKSTTKELKRRSILKRGIVTTSAFGLGGTAIASSPAAAQRSKAYLYGFGSDRIDEGDEIILEVPEGGIEIEEGFCRSCRQRIRGEEFDVGFPDGSRRRDPFASLLSPNRSFSGGEKVEVVSREESCIDGINCEEEPERIELNYEIIVELVS